MSHEEATNCIFLNEAKNKGWDTEKPKDPAPPEPKESDSSEAKDSDPIEPKDSAPIESQPPEKEDTPAIAAPTHLKLDAIQEKLLKMQGVPAENGPPALPSHRGPDHPPGPGAREPLAVQQAMALEGRASTQQPGTQGHILGNSAAFRRTPVRRQTQGLLGPPPDQVKPPLVDHGPSHLHRPSGPRQSDFPLQRGPQFNSGPDYPLGGPNRGPEFPQAGSNNGGDYRPNNVPGYPPLASNQGPEFPPRDTGRGPGPVDLMDVPVNEEEVVGFLNKNRGAWPGDQQRPGNSPEEREGAPTQDFGGPEDMARMPKAQLALFQRIQQKQKDRSQSQEQEQIPMRKGNEDNWYSDDEEAGSGSGKPPLGAPFALSSLNLPTELTNVLTAISSKGTSPGSPVSNKRVDPRRAKKEGRKELKDHEAEEREKDQRLMDLDLGSVFGDLDLPPPSPSPPRPTEEEEDITKALGLPFKPHIINVVKETNAGLNSHLPLDWALIAIDIPPSTLNEQKYNFTAVQMEADPRLRKFAKTGIAKLKELPLPSFPAPKSDPRLAKAKAAPVPAVDRRRSSEDSDGGKVYNPTKELAKARKQQQVPKATEAYSPTQEQQEFYSPGYEEQMNYQERKGESQPNQGGPAFDYPPPRDQPGNRSQMDLWGQSMDPGRHPMSNRESLLGSMGPKGSAIEQRGPPPMDRFNARGPPLDHRAPPMDERGPPNVDHRGMPMEHGRHAMGPLGNRGHPMDHRGPPMDQRGPPMDQRGPPMDHRGPPMDYNRGPPMDHRGPPMDHRGPPMDQRGPPMNPRGPVMDQRPDFYDNQRNQPYGGPTQGNWNGGTEGPKRDFRSNSPQGDFRGPRLDNRGGRGGFARKDPRRRD